MRLVDADALEPDAEYDDGEYWAYSRTQIEKAPTIEPERKRGKWLPMFEGMYRSGAYWFNCSECGHIVPGGIQSGYNYCPNCGADMRGEQGEADRR